MHNLVHVKENSEDRQKVFFSRFSDVNVSRKKNFENQLIFHNSLHKIFVQTVQKSLQTDLQPIFRVSSFYGCLNQNWTKEQNNISLDLLPFYVDTNSKRFTHVFLDAAQSSIKMQLDSFNHFFYHNLSKPRTNFIFLIPRIFFLLSYEKKMLIGHFRLIFHLPSPY